MSSTNFRELLAMPTDKFERPPALPKGHYRGKIKDHVFGESAKKKTPYVRFLFAVHEPTADVEEDTSGVDFSSKELRKDFYITPGALWRLSAMLDAVLGEQPGKSFDERLGDTRDVDVILQVDSRVSETNDKDSFNDVGNVVAV